MISAFVVDKEYMDKLLKRQELCVRSLISEESDYQIVERVALKNNKYEPDHDAPVYAEITQVMRCPTSDGIPGVVIFLKGAQHLFPHQHSVQ